VERDPQHWLYRFTPEEWLRAAENEVRHAEAALSARQQRAGVAGARRAAGMAWNAVLAAAPALDADYGRSYMEHLHALMKDPTVPEAVRQAARTLVEAPLVQTLVTLHRDTRLADAARIVVAHARERVAPVASA
jgi:hypothetical protein